MQQPPGRLRLRPHVKASLGQEKAWRTFPILQPSGDFTLLRPGPRSTHTLTHTSEARLGWEARRPKTVTASPFFIECFKDILNFKRQLPKQPWRLVEEEAGGGCQPLGDFSSEGVKYVPWNYLLKLPSLRDTKFAQSRAARRTHSPG